jgi:hypothetical protein
MKFNHINLAAICLALQAIGVLSAPTNAPEDVVVNR